jgi:hypothetical protein
VTNIVSVAIDAPVPLPWPGKPIAQAISRFRKSEALRPDWAAVRFRERLRSTPNPFEITFVVLTERLSAAHIILSVQLTAVCDCPEVRYATTTDFSSSDKAAAIAAILPPSAIASRSEPAVILAKEASVGIRASAGVA